MKSLFYMAVGGAIGWYLALNKYEETKMLLDKAKEEALKLKDELLKKTEENQQLQEEMGIDDDIGTT